MISRGLAAGAVRRYSLYFDSALHFESCDLWVRRTGVLLAAFTPTHGPEPAGTACRPPLPGLRPAHSVGVVEAQCSFHSGVRAVASGGSNKLRRSCAPPRGVAAARGACGAHPLGVLLAVFTPKYLRLDRVGRAAPPPAPAAIFRFARLRLRWRRTPFGCSTGRLYPFCLAALCDLRLLGPATTLFGLAPTPPERLRRWARRPAILRIAVFAVFDCATLRVARPTPPPRGGVPLGTPAD